MYTVMLSLTLTRDVHDCRKSGKTAMHSSCINSNYFYTEQRTLYMIGIKIQLIHTWQKLL